MIFVLVSRERGVFSPHFPHLSPTVGHSRQPRSAFKVSDLCSKHKSFTSVCRHKGESVGLLVNLNVEGLRT